MPSLPDTLDTVGFYAKCGALQALSYPIGTQNIRSNLNRWTASCTLGWSPVALVAFSKIGSFHVDIFCYNVSLMSAALGNRMKVHHHHHHHYPCFQATG
jgi:hypothetical protein